MSKIIVIEGPDRVGKRTQTNLLKQTLMSHGMLSIVVEVPIKSAITYRVIYWMLQNGLAKKFPKIFQWFQYLNRKIFQTWTLPRLEEQYDVIIMDRWSLSTIVYGSAEGVPSNFTMKLANKLRKPDFTIILYGESFAHEVEDVYEADQDLQKKVRLEYVKWAIYNTDVCTLVDCRMSKKIVARRIKEALQRKRILP
jgi:dTMP kinase